MSNPLSNDASGIGESTSSIKSLPPQERERKEKQKQSTRSISPESSEAKASRRKDPPIANQPSEDTRNTADSAMKASSTHPEHTAQSPKFNSQGVPVWNPVRKYQVVTKITKEVSNGDDTRMELDNEALERVLNNPKWAKCNVAVYSIAGPFRSGKSFLLSVLYHYFKAYFQVKWVTQKKIDGYKTDVPKNFNEIKEEAKAKLNEEVEKAFAWKGGSQRYTDGIYILSEPILFPPEKPQTALFLMDTIGLFDNQTSTQNSTFIGSLSFLISSLQIFNLKGRIESIHLEEVYKFHEIARRVKDTTPIKKNIVSQLCKKIISKPSTKKENLMFVVRDWEEEECALGIEGGKKYLNTCLLPVESADEVFEHICMKSFFKNSFQTIDCMLLPHPGSEIRNKKDHLSLKDLNKDFQETLDKMFEHILVESKQPSKQKFYLKQIQGYKLTCEELYDCIQEYAEILKDGIALDIESIIQNQLESKMKSLVLSSFQILQEEIKQNLPDSSEPCVASLKDILPKHKLEFESKIPSHSIKCFQDEWKKEFDNLLLQIINAVEVCIGVEKSILNDLIEFGKFRNKEISSDQLLTEDDKKKAKKYRVETIQKLSNDTNKLYGKMEKKPELTDVEQNQILEKTIIKQKEELKVNLRKHVAAQYEDHFLKHFKKILVKGPKEIPSKSSQFSLDLALGDIDIRPYQDFTSQASSSTLDGSEVLALSRFLEGAVTVRYLLGKVTIPLYCFRKNSIENV